MLRRPIGALVALFVVQIAPKWLFGNQRLPTFVIGSLDIIMFNSSYVTLVITSTVF